MTYNVNAHRDAVAAARCANVEGRRTVRELTKHMKRAELAELVETLAFHYWSAIAYLAEAVDMSEEEMWQAELDQITHNAAAMDALDQEER
jgi:hypothetical protein